MKTKIIVNKIPTTPTECPFYTSWLSCCNVRKGLCNLVLNNPEPCDYLIAPFTFEEESEEL